MPKKEKILKQLKGFTKELEIDESELDKTEVSLVEILTSFHQTKLITFLSHPYNL